MKKTIHTLQGAKGKRKISMLTAYDYSTAKIFDAAGVDSLLVGDSLAGVMLGFDSTLAVTMEDIIYHARSVSRACVQAFLVVDMPFMSYQLSAEDALRNAGHIMQETSAQAVKLEGGIKVCAQIKKIVQAGIPLVGHLGLTPQSVHALGGYKVQGKNITQAKQLIEDALAVEHAGACMLVLECVPEKLAEIITQKLRIPTIGIGAGAACDGQVLVWQDALGLTEGTPKFVKKFATLKTEISRAVAQYVREVQHGVFPAKENTYELDKDIFQELS